MTPDIQVDEEGERKTSIGTGGDKRGVVFGYVGKRSCLKATDHNYTITMLFFHVTLP